MIPQRFTLAISEHNADDLATWASALAGSGDEIWVVHADAPIPYTATDWQLPVDEQEVTVRPDSAIGASIARLRRQRPDLRIVEDFSTRFAAAAMAGAADRSDLLLVGPPHTGTGRAALQRVLDGAGCPVLIAPGPAPLEPILTALLRGRGSDEPVLAAAVRLAGRLRGEVLAVRPWSPPPDRSRLYVELAEQKSFDAWLEGHRAEHRAVPLVASLVLDTDPGVVVQHLDGTGPLVLDHPREWAGLDRALRDLVWAGRRPIVVVRSTVPAESDVIADPIEELVRP